MQPGWVVNQENICGRKQHSFFVVFWGFFPSPHQPIWFSARLLMGQAGPPYVVPAAGMCQEHLAGRSQRGTAHFDNTLSCSFYGRMVLESQLDLFVFSEIIYTLFDSSCCLTFLIFRPLLFLWKKCEIFPKQWILKCKHTEEVNLSLLLFLQGFALFPSCLAWAGPYPWST